MKKGLKKVAAMTGILALAGYLLKDRVQIKCHYKDRCWAYNVKEDEAT